jgi:hypothetical protein
MHRQKSSVLRRFPKYLKIIEKKQNDRKSIVDFALTTKNSTVIAHNAKAYDTWMVYKYLLKEIKCQTKSNNTRETKGTFRRNACVFFSLPFNTATALGFAAAPSVHSAHGRLQRRVNWCLLDYDVSMLKVTVNSNHHN